MSLASQDLIDRLLSALQGVSLDRAREVTDRMLGPGQDHGFVSAATEPLVLADLLGRLEVAALEADLVELRAFPGALYALHLQIPFTRLAFAEAIAFFLGKRLLGREAFEVLEDEYRMKAFTLAKATEQAIIETAHKAIARALIEGLAERSFLSHMGEAFDKAGVTRAAPHYLETVYRTNTLGAYNAGRLRQQIDPIVRAARPFWQYLTAGDERVRHTHRAMNKRVLCADWPGWSQWYPPNGFRCRCKVITLASRDLDRQKLEVEPDIPGSVDVDGVAVPLVPDEGFAAAPGA